MVDPKQRVAVLGARGIGRHHAKWWHLEGAEVCAFAGTNPDSVAASTATLKALFPFQGKGYTSIDELLAMEKPDIIDVCSPPPCHADQVRQALEAGCHVLCEKPFLYDPEIAPARLMQEAQALVDLAAAKGLRLGVCTQYTVGARLFHSFWKTRFPNDVLQRYHGHLESPAKNRIADPQRIWMDLAPHLISVVLAICPEADLMKSSVSTHFQGDEAIARFMLNQPSGSRIACELFTRNRREDPPNIRHFKLNDYLFNVEGGQDEAGHFCARILSPDGETQRPDMMRLLIRDFLHGKVDASGAALIKNLEWLYFFLSHAQGQILASPAPESAV